MPPRRQGQQQRLLEREALRHGFLERPVNADVGRSLRHRARRSFASASEAKVLP